MLRRLWSLSLLLLASALSSSHASCNYSSQFCGNISIPYPFGMSSSCGLPDFRILCKPNSSFGPGNLPFLQIGTSATPELQVLSFSNGSITINSTDLKAMPTIADCESNVDGKMKFALQDRGPFVLSDTNFFAVIGCDSNGTCNAATSSTDSTIYQLDCTTACYNEFALPYCSPYACCINALPPGSRSINFSGNGLRYLDFPDVCGFSTLLSPNTFIPTEPGVFARTGHYGLNISWGIMFTGAAQNCSTVQGTKDYACVDNARCSDVYRVPGYVCICNEGYSGDGYKEGLGCEDINECLSPDSNQCEPPPLGRCTNTDGSYYCNCTNGLGTGLRGNCTNSPSTNVVVPVVVGVSASVVTLVFALLAFLLWRARNAQRRTEEYFRRNGGEGLLQHISTSSNRGSGRRRLQATLFTPEELQRATQNFSEHNKLGSGAFGTVYKGELAHPHRVVAIKKAKNMQDHAVEQFINEILLLGQVDHPYIVRLLGCCLHMEVPLLVYEYIDNGTLLERLRDVKNGTKQLSWEMRLHIAVKSAEALAHLHSTSPPILHRDIKSANILLDQTCSPKIADFGASHFLPSGHTHLSVDALVFTMGYLDPEYYLENKFSDKSDVYSFGVVLLELITAQPAFPGSPLAQTYFTSLESGELEDLLDRSIVAGGAKHVLSSIRQVADVATKCLATEGRRRPAMREVSVQLGKIETKFRAAAKGLATSQVAIEYPTAIEVGEVTHDECPLLSSYGSQMDMSSTSVELISFSSSRGSTT